MVTVILNLINTALNIGLIQGLGFLLFQIIIPNFKFMIDTKGGLYTLGRHNNFNYNHQKTSVIIAMYIYFSYLIKPNKLQFILFFKDSMDLQEFLLALLSFQVSNLKFNFPNIFFSSINNHLIVLGHMSERTGIPVGNLAVGGPGLTFIGKFLTNKNIFIENMNFIKIYFKFIPKLCL